MKDLNWFKQEISPSFGKYEIAYRFYKNGDFGSLKSF